MILVERNNQAELLQKIQNNKDVFYAATRGVNETNLIVSSTMESIVEDIFKKERLLHKFPNCYNKDKQA